MKIMTTGNKGIRLICSNGTTFSIQFGAGNYCDNYNSSFEEQSLKPDTISSDVEVAVITKDGNWITQYILKDKSDDMVAGYIPVKEAIEIAIAYENSLEEGE